MRSIVLLLLILLCIYADPGRSKIQKRAEFVEDVLSSMSLRAKIGQMTQLTISLFLLDGTYNQLNVTALKYAASWNLGSMLNSPFYAGPIQGVVGLNATQWRELIAGIQSFFKNNVPRGMSNTVIPLLYGLDSVHGANYVYGSTLFPHNTGAAATFNPDLVKQAAVITAKDTRLSGIPWVFSPVLGLGVMPLWPRLYETFGEDPYLISVMANAMVTGLQGDHLDTSFTTASCLKSYLGYSDPKSGYDRTPAWIPERFVRQYFLPTFAAGVRSGAASVMVNSGEINGVPVHASKQYLTNVLRGELNFSGVVVTDWQDIKKLHSVHHIAASDREAVKIAIEAGIDMSMVPDDYSFSLYLMDLVQKNEIPESRINESVKRILEMKYDLGLFQNPIPDIHSIDGLDTIGSKSDREVARNMARESITLLKNDGILPLLPNLKNVLIVGPCGNSLPDQNGGWTLFWQGANRNEDFPFGSTVLQGIQSIVQPITNVRYIEGANFTDVTTIADAVAAAKNADVVIACVGEAPEAEVLGDIDDLTLSNSQMTLLNAMYSTGTPVVLVLIEARPRLLGTATNNASAVIMAYLPSSEGGQVIAEIIFGKVNPSGRLPLTYPAHSGQIGITYYHKYSETYNPLYAFGSGLSYTTFSYSAFSLNASNITIGDTLGITVNVTNTGNRTGKESVLLYVSDIFASITPEVKMLKRFTKVEIDPFESIQVSFSLTTDDLMFIGLDNKPVLEAGTFVVQIGQDQQISGQFNVYLNSDVPTTTGTDPLVFQNEADFIAGAILMFIALSLVVMILLSMLYCNRHTLYGYIRTQDHLETNTKKRKNAKDSMIQALTDD